MPIITCDVAVVGAGPGGTAAAVTATRGGAGVVLVDGEARPGGQYWRHGSADVAETGVVAEHRAQWRAVSRRLDQALASGRLTYLARTRVWRLDPPGESAPADLHAVRSGRDGDIPVRIRAAAVVLATGAHDRVLPFPGWDLPGVLTAGAAQALLKEHGVVAGSRVVVGGTGPFLLPVAAALADAGAHVLEVAEAGTGRGWARGWRAAAGAPGKIADGVRYAALLARHRVPVHCRHAVVAASGDGRLDAVTVARVDGDWRAMPGTERRVECDAVAVSWGFAARLELALQAGCDTGPGPDGAPAVRVDAVGRTSAPSVLAAGEIAGVGGADLAVLEGAVAGTAAAAVAAGREPVAPHPGIQARRERLAGFAAAMHAAHPIRPGWTGWLTPDTVVCRCEEVSVAAVREAVEQLGADDPRTVKLLTRAGMGWCQGRMCGEAVAGLVADATGTDVDPFGGALAAASRPVAAPVPLGAVAAEEPDMPIDRQSDPRSGGPS
ncbi:MAG TPA: NAD(P)/FAD-dependent oxidoreductase [Kineosporiaceae bacterium]|nr:NAD(P)/FAD-dependent oxidoreductase [Kineosporiaceae bacterium]